jgi:hypothetical protein
VPLDTRLLDEHLDNQLSLLDALCISYDSGQHIAYLALATTIRTLVHDTANSKSLLMQMAVKDVVHYYDGVHVIVTAVLENPQTTGSFPGLALLQGSEAGWSYEPTFVGAGLIKNVTNFSVWWDANRMLDANGNRLSRRNLVLGIANKGGGAHIDKLPLELRALTQESSMGVEFDSSDPYRSPVPAAIRHIAEELRIAIRDAVR